MIAMILATVAQAVERAQEPMHANVAQAIMLIVGLALTVIAGAIQRKKSRAKLKDDTPDTGVTRGGFLPVVIGRRRVGCIIGYASSPRQTTLGSTSGKRQGPGGSGNQNYEYDVIHEVCVGPAFSIDGIWVNGKKATFGVGQASNVGGGGLNAFANPSGTLAGVYVDGVAAGLFRIYWGEKDQPIDPLLTALGTATRWPLACFIVWAPLKVGNIKQVPQIEVDVSCLPHSTLANTPAWIPASYTDSASATNWSYGGLYGGYVLGQVGTRSIDLPNVPLGSLANRDVIRISGPAASAMFGRANVHAFVFNTWQIPFSPGPPPVPMKLRVFVGEDTRYRVTINNPQVRGDETVTKLTHDENDGVNYAHAIEHVMFAPKPRGAGMRRDWFDMSSLEQVGETVAGELLLCHMAITDGDEPEGVLSKLLLDAGVAISLNPSTGKYVFVAVRQDLTASKPKITMILPPLPEMEHKHGPLHHLDEVVFSFQQRQRDFRASTYTVHNDGRAAEGNDQNLEVVDIETTTDFRTAQSISLRREREGLVRHTVLKIHTAGDARTLYPGIVIECLDVPFALRVVTVQPKLLTSEVIVECAKDAFGSPKQSLSALEGDPPPVGIAATGFYFPHGEAGGFAAVAPAMPTADLAIKVFEPSRYFENQTVKLCVLRVRADTSVGDADVWISRDDATYYRVLTGLRATPGGTLVNTLSATAPWEMPTTDTSLLITPLGPDIAQVEDLSAMQDAARLGRQLMIVDDEVMYVLRVTAQAGGQYSVEGVLRARLGTQKAQHNAGATCFFALAHQIRPFADVLLQPKRTVHVKVQPTGVNLDALPADVASRTSIVIAAVARKPMDMENLYTATNSDYWLAGGDLSVEWGFRNGDSYKSGAGMQGAGDPTEVARVEGEFIVRVYDGDPDAAGVLKRTESDIAIAAWVYTNSQMVTDFGAAPASLWITVQNVKGGLKSNKIKRQFFKV